MTPNEVEDKVLCCLLEPELAQKISQRAEAQWFPHRRVLLEAGLAEHRAGNLLTTAGWAKRYADATGMQWNEAGEQIGGILEHSWGCKENLDRYLEILREAWVRSEMREESIRLAEGAEPISSAGRLKELASDLVPKQPSETLRSLLPRAVGDFGRNDLEHRIRTGLDSLDAMLGGGMPNGIVTLAARTSVGKSALAVNIATQAVMDGVPTLYFSLEMNTLALTKRCLSHLSGVPLMPGGSLTQQEIESVEAAHRELDRAGLLLRFPAVDGRAWTPEWFDAECDRAKPLGLVILDYLTLMTAKGQNRYEEIAHILGALRAATARLECPILMLAQINRAPEGRSDKRPMLSDLRDSGNIEEVSDVVLLLHRAGMYDRNVSPNEAELGIAKNREGATGIVKLRWRPETTSFFDGP